MIGRSPGIQQVLATVSKVARVDATVLVTGESGTGKELVARTLHCGSLRVAGPFVAVNCSAIPQNLVESEFFGHIQGAFTDARDSRIGRFEQADHGTLFLDEVGDLAIDAQAKLLRVLQERRYTPVGAREPRDVDVRLVAATNKNLEQEVAEGRFRDDLYWRLNVVHVELPPLRERRQDIPLLCNYLVSKINRQLGLSIRGITPEAMRVLVRHDWPGNVRELENTLCRSMVLASADVLQEEDLPARLLEPEKPISAAWHSKIEGRLSVERLDRMTLAEAVGQATEQVEKQMILSRLLIYHGNRTATAESLGISRKTLFNKIRQYDLEANGDDGIRTSGAQERTGQHAIC